VDECKPLIAGISTEATQESALEELLNKVTTKWGDVEFQCVSYKVGRCRFTLSNPVLKLESAYGIISA